MTTEDAWDQESEQSWERLETRLATWLGEVPPDEMVLIELAWPDDALDKAQPYVQLAVEGMTVRSEAVSNHYLDPRFRLDDGRVDELLALGWCAPTKEESSNFWRDDELPAGAAKLADVLVATLRFVYGVPAPSFLQVSGSDEQRPLEQDELPFGLATPEPLAPVIDLTVRLAADADELRDLVADAVASVIDVEVEFDADGDIPVPATNTVVYVRVEEDAPSVTLFTAVLRDVRWTPRVGHTLNEVNKGIRYGRVVFHAGHVLLEYRLFCRPFVPELLRHAVVGMTGLVDGLDVDLQERIGGHVLSDHQDGVA